MKTTLMMLSLLLPLPVFAQTMYKCPNAAGTVNFQQMPCTPTGGGEAVAKKEIKSTGSSMMSESAKSYLADVESQRAKQAKIEAEESKRQEALNVERGKSAAQRETARAIDRQTAVMAAPRVITIRRR
ncbi:MAG: DUF4124 domain-containing protein [Candidatus Competibacteraceae bacterium]|jgi:hypothetical protein